MRDQICKTSYDLSRYLEADQVSTMCQCPRQVVKMDFTIIPETIEAGPWGRLVFMVLPLAGACATGAKAQAHTAI